MGLGDALAREKRAPRQREDDVEPDPGQQHRHQQHRQRLRRQNPAASTPRAASTKPQNWLPTSPMNMRAVGKIERQESRDAGGQQQGCHMGEDNRPGVQPMPAMKRQAIATEPLARPFSPSMKLTALVANTIQAAVTGTPHQPRSTAPSEGQMQHVQPDAAGDGERVLPPTAHPASP